MTPSSIPTIIRDCLSADDLTLLRELVASSGYRCSEPPGAWAEKFEALGLVFRHHKDAPWMWATRLGETVASHNQ
jgi:hypothetical protein